MPTPDEQFLERLRATFKVEADEHLQTMMAILLELEKSSGAAPQTQIETIYREAHSLKGAARAVDFLDIEAICQPLEGIFSAWKQQKALPSQEAFDALHHALDFVRTLLDSPNAAEAGTQRRREEAVRRLNQIQLNAPPVPHDTDRVAPLDAAPTIPPPAPIQQPPIQQPQISSPPIPPPAPPAETDKVAASDTMRVSVEKLDSLLLQAEDMLTIKAMAARRSQELRAITALFDQWSREWAKVSTDARGLRHAIEQQATIGAGGPTPDAPNSLVNFLEWNVDHFRSVQNKLASLSAQSDQDRHGVGRRVDDLLEASKKLVMLSFSTLSALLAKVVRDLCRDQQKEAEVVIRGDDVEIDKRILEEIKDALIHAVRNCVDHGVQDPVQRAREKKPRRATITIATTPLDGNKVEVTVSDDGVGVDLARVKASAVRQGILSNTDAGTLSDADALSLVFHSDVSTSPIVTTISGRGLGMAILRAKVEKLGGRVEIESVRGVGTTLRMILPLTLATVRGVVVMSEGQTFVLPTFHVERVTQIKPAEIQTAENREVISVQGRSLAVARLNAVLGLTPKTKVGNLSDAIPLVVLRSAEERIAFVVDEILHEEEVLVKPFRKPLVRVRNVAGATVLGSGKAVPVLNVTDLLKSARTRPAAAAPAAAAAPNAKAQSRNILVVEDSITSRMLLKGILETAGYHVRAAVDGVDALTILREGPFDLVVSDVEMPRMNGFDLTRRIRSDKRLSELPVVLVSALESREERERGIDAGASAYITKSSFDQSNLLEVVQRLI
jgi:two-component system chemotaxis sensor kinase CheA